MRLGGLTLLRSQSVEREERGAAGRRASLRGRGFIAAAQALCAAHGGVAAAKGTHRHAW